MRVLALTVNWRGWMYETLWHEQCALAAEVERRGGELVFVGPGFERDDLDAARAVAAVERGHGAVDLVLNYVPPNQMLRGLPRTVTERYNLRRGTRFPRRLGAVRGPVKVAWINDFWQMSHDDWRRGLLDTGVSAAIAAYAPPFLRREHFHNAYPQDVREWVRFYPMPRAIDPTPFASRPPQREHDVTLLGAIGPFYPLRTWFHETLAAQSWFRYLHRPHPGYGFEAKQGTLRGQAYFDTLMRSRIFVSCTGSLNIPFIKLYEALAAETLLMSDAPCGAAELGLVDGETFVRVSQHNLLEKIQYYLSHERERARIAANGRRLFEQRHTTAVRAVQMADVLESIATARAEPGIGDLRAGRAAWRTPVKRLRQTLTAPLSRFRRTPPPPPAPAPLWEPVKGGSRLDWRKVVEQRHITEIDRVSCSRDMERITRFGLNAWVGARPVITQHPELVAVRPVFLRNLVRVMGARWMAEVGTARGLQSLFWAQTLVERGPEPGGVFTCDVVGHDDPVYRTPASGAHRWTRRELWQGEAERDRVRFVTGTSQALAVALASELPGDAKLDLIYIDGQHDRPSVQADYTNLQPFMSNHCVVVFDDCDPRFPGVEEAVNAIADEHGQTLRVISFSPSFYRIAVMNCPIALGEIAQRARRGPHTERLAA